MKRKMIHICYFLMIAVFSRTQTLFATKVKPRVPIVLVHGINSDASSMEATEKFIEKYLPETYYKSVNICKGVSSSFCNMYDQVECFVKEIQDDPELQNGFNIIAHSQGGLIARYYVERYNNPRVYNYISWGSPQQGVCGTPGTIDERFTWLNYMEAMTHRVLYSTMFQRYVSFAGYWHDTVHYDRYLEFCCFLPYLNNEKDHVLSDLFKYNICSLQNMVLVQSTQELVIEPAISCHFGFYKIGSKIEQEPLEQTRIYQNDLLGLKTLDQTGRLHLKIAHCYHVGYQDDEDNFVNNTLPYLVLEPDYIQNTLHNENEIQA